MSKKRDFAVDNLKIACERMKALIADPSLLKGLPDEPFNAISLPLSDLPLLKHNLEVMARTLARAAPPGAEIELTIKMPKASDRSREKDMAVAAKNWRVSTAASTA